MTSGNMYNRCEISLLNNCRVCSRQLSENTQYCEECDTGYKSVDGTCVELD